MEKTKKLLILRIVAIILGAFLVIHDFYYLIQQWSYYIDYGTSVYNITTAILAGFLIVILIGLIVNKIAVSIGSFCIYFTATLLNAIPFFEWGNMFSGDYQKYTICINSQYFIHLFIAVGLLLFLRNQISAKFSIILIAILSLCKLFVSWASSYFFYKEVAPESIKESINMIEYIFSNGTFLFIVQFLLMFLCIILYTKSKK